MYISHVGPVRVFLVVTGNQYPAFGLCAGHRRLEEQVAQVADSKQHLQDECQETKVRRGRPWCKPLTLNILLDPCEMTRFNFAEPARPLVASAESIGARSFP
jgi:hypothetical protein